MTNTKQVSDAKLTARIQLAHTKLKGCSNWETWTEKNVPLVEGGHADITFDGCRKHQVAMAR